MDGMATTLKDGSIAADPRLGRIKRQDLNSLNFLVTARREVIAARTPRSYTWSVLDWLDQGFEGACVGFGFSHDALARPAVVSGISNTYARFLYWLIQKRDDWPGGAYPGATPFYEGTAVLTGAKVMTELGYYSGYDWGLDARQVADGIAYTGPSILGIDWMRNMANPDSEGFIHATGEIDGGHCILAKAVKIVYKTWISTWFSRKWENVDMERSYITLHNSWGRNWGVDGCAKLSLADLDVLLAAGGEACFPRRDPLVKMAVTVPDA